MFKRQSLLAIGSGRPACSSAVRASGIRCRSDIQLADRQRAQEKGSNTMPTNPPPEETNLPRNNPTTGRTRHQRAAQVSEEVRMLNRGSPAAKVPGNNSPYPSVQSRDVDAEAVLGEDLSGRGQMGSNAPAGREGPNAQGAGRVVRAGQGRDESRSERSPSGAVEDPSEGGARALEESAQFADQVETEDDGPTAPSTQHELVLLQHFDRQDITAVPFEPEPVTKDDFLKLGQGGATIAAANFEGVIEDRLRMLAEPTQDSFRWAPDIAARMMKGGFVSFNSDDEKKAVIAAAEKHVQKGLKAYPQQRLGEPAGTPAHDFSPVPQKEQSALFDKLVRGSYTHPSSAPHKRPILNDIVRNTLRNSTYLEADQSKFLRKITSLLPAETAASRKPAASSKATK